MGHRVFEKPQETTHQVQVAGWWISNDLPTIGQLPFQGNAYYSGHAFGTAALLGYEGWEIYNAKGAALDAALAAGLPYAGWCPKEGWAEDLPSPPGLLVAYPHLKPTPLADPAQRTEWSWDFGERSGTLAISNFVDDGHLPVLNVSGTMTIPGELGNNVTNKFSGPLLGTLGSQNNFNESSYQPLPTIEGSAVGSFAANGNDKAAGVIGNFNVGNEYYKTSGIFGAGRAAAPSQ